MHVDHGPSRHEGGELALSLPPLVDAEGLAAEDLAVESERRLEILHDEDDVIERGDHVRR